MNPAPSPEPPTEPGAGETVAATGAGPREGVPRAVVILIGAVAACGLAQGMDLPATVAPFILRGVSLLGVDSVMAPQALRREAWARLAKDLDRAKLAAMTTTVKLADTPRVAADILAGQTRGRVVVEVA